MQGLRDNLPEDYPITGVCIVTHPSKCPDGYKVVDKSYDKGDDTDLWKDSFFKSRVTRYLCITRLFPLDYGRLNNVLADVSLQNDRDPVPEGFSEIGETVDTKEKALKKRQLSCKMLPRDSTSDAICELILLSRSRRPPPGYTMVGEINQLLICYKYGRVPPETQGGQNGQEAQSMPPSYMSVPPTYSMDAQQQQQSPSSHPQALPYALNPAASNGGPSGPTQTSSQTRERPTLTRKESVLMPNSPESPMNAMAGVMFQLNPRFKEVMDLKQLNIPELSYRSLVDLESEYDYGFRLERTAALRIVPSPE